MAFNFGLNCAKLDSKNRVIMYALQFKTLTMQLIIYSSQVNEEIEFVIFDEALHSLDRKEKKEYLSFNIMFFNLELY